MGLSSTGFSCVHLIDDEDAVRRSITFTLASGGFLTRAYASASEFLETADGAAAGCILTDVRMPGLSGMDLLDRLEPRSSDFAVVVMSGHADIPLAVEAMKRGAVDFLQKPFRREALLQAVSGALEGLSRRARDRVPESAAAYRARFSGLSPRQLEVLRGILDGKLNKVIAHELGLSVRTVEDYRGEILARTQARSLSELVRLAVLAGY